MENASSSRSRSLGRQRDSSLERQRAPSVERQRPPSAERQRVPGAERQRSAERQRASTVSSSDRHYEKQRGTMYPGGKPSSAPAVKSNNSAYLQQTPSGEQELSQGQESSRRYAAFLRQDGLLPSDLDNFNTAYNRCLSNVADKSSSQTSMRLESPNDEIAPERLGIPKRRPATTPAALFHLPSSKSHPGPGIACNFDINFDPPTDISKPSTTSLEEEVAVFQNGLNDVTLQLECIQATQGTILSELAHDIEALQAENTYLRESRNRLQCANDNLLKVVQDLTKELALKKSLDPHLSSSSKNLMVNKTPQDMLKGLETILNSSRTNLDETNEQQTPSKSRQKDKSAMSSNSNKLKSSPYPPGKKPHSKSYSRGDVPRPKTQSSQHDLEDRRRASSSRQLKGQHDDEENEPHPTPRRHQRRTEDQVDYEDDSDSDEYYSNKKERRKKKKNGCFSFARKRDSRDHDRNRHHNRD